MKCGGKNTSLLRLYFRVGTLGTDLGPTWELTCENRLFTAP
jgi:hypothetical protein